MSNELADAVFEAIGTVTEPLLARIRALEGQVDALKAAAPVPGPPGLPGERGPQGEKGEPSLVSGPAGPAGADGRDGADAPAPTLDQVKEALGQMTDAISKALAEHVEAHPAPAGLHGKDGRDGVDGKDGAGLAGAVIDRDGALVVTMTDGTTKALGLVVGAPGATGKDGRDGLGFEDLHFDHDDVGRLVLRFTRGDVTKSSRVPGFHFREVFKAGADYVAGDVVQWGGDMFVALIDGATLVPGTGAEAAKQWRMAVRRGREGSKGPKGETGERGPKGEQGMQGPTRW